MWFAVLIFIAGLMIASLALRDVFETVVVPSGNRSSLRVAHRLISLLLPVWKIVRGRRRGLSGTFAPMVLVASFIIWMSLLAIGFGLMIYAAQGGFRPPPQGVAEAIYQAGAVIITLGLNDMRAVGAGRWIVLAAGFCGLGVMTLAVTYLLAVQSSLAKRDTAIIKLNTAAGDPPAALALLETLALVDDRDELADILREGRNWCATVRQSHAAHPSLIYFQTTGTGAGWPASLGALIDLGLIVETILDDRRLGGPATLLVAEGARLAGHVSSAIGLATESCASTAEDVERLTERLSQAGYALRAGLDP
ncbi:MAG: hypothetical protein Q8K85_04590, partial [Hyphomicrobium sp.]|nr:hypothetical protein [Hyphomicrobium sp.]